MTGSSKRFFVSQRAVQPKIFGMLKAPYSEPAEVAPEPPQMKMLWVMYQSYSSRRRMPDVIPARSKTLYVRCGRERGSFAAKQGGTAQILRPVCFLHAGLFCFAK